jgi:hypothetical protein
MSKRIKFFSLRQLEARIAELQEIYFHVEVISVKNNVADILISA